MKNYYEILEVNESASREVIEKAYKILIKKYHPDLYNGQERIYAEQRVRDLNEAYKILSDDFLREQYNNELENERMMKYNRNFYSDSGNGYNYATKNRAELNKSKMDNGEGARKNQIGTISSTIDLVKEIFKVKPKKIDFKSMNETDLKALGLTIVILIILGIVLWFIPFTNGFMRSLTVDNPLFSWILK